MALSLLSPALAHPHSVCRETSLGLQESHCSNLSWTGTSSLSGYWGNAALHRTPAVLALCFYLSWSSLVMPLIHNPSLLPWGWWPCVSGSSITTCSVGAPLSLW